MSKLYYQVLGMAVAVIMTAIAVFPYTLRDVDLMSEVIYHENWCTDKEHKAASER